MKHSAIHICIQNGFVHAIYVFSNNNTKIQLLTLLQINRQYEENNKLIIDIYYIYYPIRKQAENLSKIKHICVFCTRCTKTFVTSIVITTKSGQQYNKWPT